MPVPETAEGVTHIVRLPTWSMLKPVIDVGQKAEKNADLVLPARIDWAEPLLVALAPGESTRIAWRITNMGHRLSGESEVNEFGLVEPIPGQINGGTFSTFSVRDFERKRSKLVTDGGAARWEVLHSFNEYTRSKIIEASRTLAQEFSEYSGKSIPGVLDDHAIDSLLTHMLLGDDPKENANADGSSLISRMVDKALQPDAFNRVDPARYFSFNIRRSAIGEVRRVINDPHIGSKVRRIHKLSGAKSLDELMAHYNAHYPNEHLGAKRAMNALTAGNQLEVMSAPLMTDDELREFAGRRGKGAR